MHHEIPSENSLIVNSFIFQNDIDPQHTASAVKVQFTVPDRETLSHESVSWNLDHNITEAVFDHRRAEQKAAEEL